MTRILLATTAALAASGTAFADTGAHGHGVVTEIIHWMSSPAHGLFAVAAVVAVGAAGLYFIRKKA